MQNTSVSTTPEGEPIETISVELNSDAVRACWALAHDDDDLAPAMIEHFIVYGVDKYMVEFGWKWLPPETVARVKAHWNAAREVCAEAEAWMVARVESYTKG